jgi:predicted alpha/beta hydrolase family esterase
VIPLSTSVGTGEYVAGETHMGASGPRVVAASRRGVVIHGGRGQSALSNMPPDLITQALVAMGAPVLYGDFVDGRTWGSDLGQTRLGQLWTLQKNNFGAKNDKVVLYGSSMGALVVLNWARANPASVAAIALVIPATDLRDLHDNAASRGAAAAGAAAEIETAYGGAAAYAAAATAHNPAENAASYRGLPMKIWYSGDDPTCLPSITTAFASGAGAEAQNIGNFGHGSNSAYAGSVVDFLGSYA